jgi:hypothetical protein
MGLVRAAQYWISTKSQTPNPKHQIPNTKSQISSPAYRQAGMTKIQNAKQVFL